MRLFSEQETAVPGEGDDDDLVRRAQKDPRAFGPIYHRFVVRVYRYVCSRVGDSVESEEITSQVFVDAMQGLKGYRPRGSFAGWLFAIARRRCVDHYRRRMDSSLRDDMVDGLSRGLIEQAIDRETLERLHDVLVRLSEGERELLRLRYAAGLSHRQIGQLLGRTEGAIKMAMTRLMRKTRTMWEADDG